MIQVDKIIKKIDKLDFEAKFIVGTILFAIMLLLFDLTHIELVEVFNVDVPMVDVELNSVPTNVTDITPVMSPRLLDLEYYTSADYHLPPYLDPRLNHGPDHDTAIEIVKDRIAFYTPLLDLERPEHKPYIAAQIHYHKTLLYLLEEDNKIL